MKRRQQLTLCGIRPRSWANLVSKDPWTVRYTWPCGYEKDVLVDEDKTLKKIAKVLLERFTTGERGYWTKGGGGIADECPRCRRKAKKAELERKGGFAS
jgi:hypothetical protein